MIIGDCSLGIVNQSDFESTAAGRPQPVVNADQTICRFSIIARFFTDLADGFHPRNSSVERSIYCPAC